MEEQAKYSLKKNHADIDAKFYCIECNTYLCNKCSNNHSEVLENHHTYELNKNIKEIFTGICQELNHKNELFFYCNSHNKLCCAACLSKIKNKGFR